MLNSSWYIGFDRDGNPISGHVSIKRDGSRESLSREKCYQFSKLNSLPTDTKLFPEAKKQIQQQQQQQQLHNINQTKQSLSTDSINNGEKQHNDLSDKKISSSPMSMAAATAAAAAAAAATSPIESLAEVADLLHSKGPIVHSIHQSQLIDIVRYRNILRYQLGRKLGQPLVAMNETTNIINVPLAA